MHRRNPSGSQPLYVDAFACHPLQMWMPLLATSFSWWFTAISTLQPALGVAMPPAPKKILKKFKNTS
jgi:hypothetical protein